MSKMDIRGFSFLNFPNDEIEELTCLSRFMEINLSTGDEICDMHLIDRCNELEVACDKVHSSTPYLWQSWNDSQWSSLTSNEEIEQDYCDPAKTKHLGAQTLYFDTMTCGSAAVRRLSISTTALFSLSPLVTKWVWYWEESENIWKEFGPLAGVKQSSSLTSDELERRYLNGETAVTFTAGIHQYQLSFLDMLQTNVTAQTQRLVRRRPMFISKADILKVCTKHCSKVPPIVSESLPGYWNPHLLLSAGFERIKLDTASPEYSKVLNCFNRTMAGSDILNIERIQNLTLWKFFNLQKDNMETRAGRDVPERFLFHGTKSEYVDAICRENIDWRLCGENGTHYGRGSYFARDADYSNRFTDMLGTQFMFLCRILVGDFTVGHPDYNKPPFKDKNKKIGFDSCVNKLNNPSIFVIFEKNQIYPEYLIQYEEPFDVVQVVPPVQVAPPVPVPLLVKPLEIQTSSTLKTGRCGCDCDCQECCLDFLYYLFCCCCDCY